MSRNVEYAARYTQWRKGGLTVVSTEHAECVLMLLLLNYCTIFRMNNCKPTLPHLAWEELHVLLSQVAALNI